MGFKDPSVIPCREGLDDPPLFVGTYWFSGFWDELDTADFTQASVCTFRPGGEEQDERCEGEKKIMEGSTRNYEGAKRNLSRSPGQ